MVYYSNPSVLQQLCSKDYLSFNFGANLVQVVAIVLDSDVRTFYLSHWLANVQSLIFVCFFRMMKRATVPHWPAFRI